jgi:hypothetical protein
LLFDGGDADRRRRANEGDAAGRVIAVQRRVDTTRQSTLNRDAEGSLIAMEKDRGCKCGSAVNGIRIAGRLKSRLAGRGGPDRTAIEEQTGGGKVRTRESGLLDLSRTPWIIENYAFSWRAHPAHLRCQ